METGRSSGGRPKLFSQVKELFPLLLALYVPALLALLIAVIVVLRTGVSMGELTRDPAAIVHRPPYTGVLSYAGILTWCATAAICLFSARLLRAKRAQAETGTFLLWAGTITLLLLFDDLFQFHERVFPSFGISEELTVAMYGLLVSLFVWSFRRLILESGYVLLLIAFLFFAMSVLVDLVPEGVIRGHHLFEDGFKLLGIVGWFGYYSREAFQALHRSLPTR